MFYNNVFLRARLQCHIFDILQIPVYYKPPLETCLQSDNVITSQSSGPERRLVSLKVMFNIGAYSDRFIEIDNPDKNHDIYRILHTYSTSSPKGNNRSPENHMSYKYFEYFSSK